MKCDNKADTYIANNHLFNERTKHIEVDYHYIYDPVQSGVIFTFYVNSKAQVANIFIKPLSIGSS